MSSDSHATGRGFPPESNGPEPEHMAWQIDYCIMKELMSILRGRKSVSGMNSSEREMERGYYSAFTDHTKETSTGSITTHADNSLPEYDSFLFENEANQGELTSVSMECILGELRVYVPNILPTHPILLLDSQFIPSDDSIGSDLEVSFPSKTRNKIFDPGIFFEVQSKRFLSRDTFSPTYVSLPFEDRHYLSFTYVI
nr:hypothetical protein [Tanacetum cinerariifolium]